MNGSSYNLIMGGGGRHRPEKSSTNKTDSFSNENHIFQKRPVSSGGNKLLNPHTTTNPNFNRFS